MGEKRSITEIARRAAIGVDVAEFRELAQAAGVTGRPGGWIYLLDATKPVAQGWQGLATAMLDAAGFPWTVRLAEAMAVVQESRQAAPRLAFRAAGVTSREHQEGSTAYEASAAGVTYRVIGTVVDPASGRRTFRAYRVTGNGGHTLTPAGKGGEHKTRAAAYAQAEADLAEVLRDREALTVRCDGCGNLHPVAEMTHERIVDMGSSESDYRCRTCGPLNHDRVTTTTAARRAELPESTGILPSAHRCGDCSFVTASAERMDGHLRATGHTPQQFPAPVIVARAELPEPDSIEYELTKLRGAFSLACRSRDLWKGRALKVDAPAEPATEDDIPELVDRIVRRASYVALRAVLAALDGWIEGAGDECWTRFHPDGIRTMINDAARELGTVEPWKPNV